jgi:hypothetical protein
MTMRTLSIVLFTMSLSSAQTTIDLKNQTRNWDLSGVTFTRVFKVGTSLPSLCTTGDLFFNPGAVPGANIYGCVSTNVWAAQGTGSSSTGGTAAGSGVTIASGNSVIGTPATVNFVSALGVLLTFSTSGSTITMVVSLDPAVAQLKANAQSGGALLCASTSASSESYTCSMTPTLGLNVKGEVINWLPDVSCGPMPSLNVDTLGSVPIRRSDGTAIQAGDCPAGQLQQIWFDGATYRLIG